MKSHITIFDLIALFVVGTILVIIGFGWAGGIGVAILALFSRLSPK